MAGFLSQFNKPVVPQRVTKVTTPEQQAEADRRAAAKKAEEEKLGNKAPKKYYDQAGFYGAKLAEGTVLLGQNSEIIKKENGKYSVIGKISAEERAEFNKTGIHTNPLLASKNGAGNLGEALKIVSSTDNYDKYLAGKNPSLEKQIQIIKNPANAEQLNKILADPKSEYLGDVISSKSRDKLLSSDLFANASPEALQAGSQNLNAVYKDRVFETSNNGGIAYRDPNGNFMGWKVPPPQPKKKRGLVGGFIGDVLGDIGGVLSNPIVQLGVTALGGGGLVAGFNAGQAIGSGDIAGAAKNFAIGQIGGAVGNAAGNAVGGAASNALGSSIVGDVLSTGISGATAGGVGALLSGGDLGDSILKGVIGGTIGGAANQLANGVINQFKPVSPTYDQATPDYDTQDVPEVVGGGGGNSINNPVFNLPLDTLTGGTGNVGISNKYFTPNTDINLNNLGGTFNSNVGLNTPTTPFLGGDGTGLIAPIYNPDGTTQGYQGVNGATTPNFQIAIGNPNSFVNNPNLTGTPMTSGGSVANPNLNAEGGLAGIGGGSLADLGSTQSGQPIGSTSPTQPTAPTAPEADNTAGAKKALAGFFKDLLGGLVAGGSSNPLTQSPTQGGNTGNNMADYSGLLSGLVGQNQQINRIQDLAGQQEGKFNAVAQGLENKPFTPYNVTSSAGSNMVNGQNINNTLGANQQKLADVAGQAAGMFGEVNVPNAENIRNTALQGSQNLLQQAQGFNPQSAAQMEFDALQQLYKPQRERDQLALENRLRAQGRLGASDNPALRQLFEAQGQQDLQAAINSRNLGFERQQQLQNLSQGMFTQGSQAAKLPTDIQATRAQIGQMGANASQLPFNTLNNQQQLANQLAATQATQGTALATRGADLRQTGIQGQAGLLSQAAQMQNNRDLSVIQGLLGGGGVQANNPLSGAINAGGNALSGAISNGFNSLLSQGASAIGNYFNGSNNGSMPPIFSLSSDAINSMSDDDFLSALLNGGSTYGTSEGE